MDESGDEYAEDNRGVATSAPPDGRLGAISKELARRTRELARSEARFRDVIERNADAIIVIGQDGAIQFANHMATVLFGKSRDALYGTPFGFPVVAGETTELDLLGAGNDCVVEMRVVDSEWDGQAACLASLRDITERKLAEHNARRLTAEQAARTAAEGLAADNARLFEAARKANQAKADFLAVVSHDLRTPLSAIIGFAGLLDMGIPETLSQASRRHVDRIRTSAQHLLYLLNELLAFARLDAGGEHASLQDIDVRDVIRDAGVVMEPLALTRGLRLVIDLPDAPVTARTDPDKLRQVVLNLVANAVRYTRDGTVRVDAVVDAGRVLIRVQDTGIGIDAAHLEQIFEPFWQVDRSQRTRDGGTGLGLSVVRRMLDLLGGEVLVSSAPGNGSVFSVWIPRGSVGNETA